MDGNQKDKNDRKAAALSSENGEIGARLPAQIIVLGMHRSGTSAMTGALDRMGVFVGEEDALTGKNWENPLGFFERRDARAICDSLLHGSGADWWKVANFDPERIPHSVLPAQLKQMKAMIEALEQGARESAKNSRALAWAIKEPRLCLLFPVLRRALIDPIPIFVVRHPLETALSLRHRNGFPLTAGLALWEAYNVAVLRNLAGLNPIRTRYEDLILHPQKTLNQIAGALSERGVAGLMSDKGREGIRDSLKREDAASDGVQGPLSPTQSALWTALSTPSDEKFADLLINPPILSEDARAVLLDFETDETSRQAAHAEIRSLRDQLKREREANQKTTQKARERIQALEANLEAEISRVVEWREGVNSRDGAIAVLKQELAAQRETAERNAKRLGEQEKTISIVSSQFTDYKELASKSIDDAKTRAEAAEAVSNSQSEKLKALEAAKEDDAKRLKGDLAKAKSATEKAEKKFSEMRARSAQLREECDGLSERLDVRRQEDKRLKKSLRWKLGGIALAPMAPFLTLRKIGLNGRTKKAAKKIKASGLFDETYYTDAYADVVEADIDPLTHYIRFGWREGRNPSAKFDVRWYLENNQDVRAAGVEPLLHYIEFGRDEGRAPLSPHSSTLAGREGSGAQSPSSWVQGDVARIRAAPTVLLCAHSVSDRLFGGERSFLDMVEALQRLKLNVIVALPTDKHRFYVDLIKARCSGVAIIEYQHWKNDRSLEADVTTAFVSLIKEHGVDLVYTNTIVLLEPLEAARLCGIANAVHVRELIDRDDHLCDYIGLTASEIIERVFNASDFVIANSQETAKLFYREGKTFSAPNVVDIEALDVTNDVSSSIRFVIASSNIPKKGIDDFIEVAGRCASLGLNAKFIVVGPENKHVETWREKASANVQFVGYRETPAAAMAEGNVVLSLSHFAESFGRTVAEAHAARRPAIAYDHGAVSELIDDGQTGYLIGYRDINAVVGAVKKFCDDPSSVRVMGEAGRARVLRENAPDILSRNLQTAMSGILGRQIAERSVGEVVLAPPADRRLVTILVPVYNAYQETRDCLESLARTIDLKTARVLILDDASTDERIGPLLEKFAQREGFTLITQEKNIGYTANINAGVKNAGNDDIILLNSDTIVTPGFVEGLQRAAYAKDKTGTATAMGDNAGAFSFPVCNEPNPKPVGISHDDYAAAILERTKECRPVDVPTGSGFCLYIRRALIDEIGLFDEKGFPRGYGEENDFCMRGMRAGWGHVISPYAYVFHVRSASFGDEREMLIDGAVEAVTKRYPEYPGKVKEAFASEDMAALRKASVV